MGPEDRPQDDEPVDQKEYERWERGQRWSREATERREATESRSSVSPEDAANSQHREAGASLDKVEQAKEYLRDLVSPKANIFVKLRQSITTVCDSHDSLTKLQRVNIAYAFELISKANTVTILSLDEMQSIVLRALAGEFQ